MSGGFVTPPDPARVPIAGRIEHTPGTLPGLVDEWLAHMAAMRKSELTIQAYRSHVRTAIRENGWSSPADLTYDAVVGYLQAAGENWQGNTYNRNLTIWRTLCKWLMARKILDEDPLALASQRPDDAGPGSRAATTDEVRRMVSHAWARAKVDSRASPYTPRYYAIMALCGCRAEDHADWRWRHLALDEPVPFVTWEPDQNKNGRRQYLALAPEAADLLRSHREQCAALGNPTGPDDPVWPKAVSPGTFRRYRKEIGVSELDAFGMRFSAHSFRKWLSTTLTNAGVPAKMVDVLMRHTGSVEARYYKPTLEEQRRALDLLPRIWPEIIGQNVNASSWQPKVCETTAKIGVDSTANVTDTSSATRSSPTKIKPTAAAHGRASEPFDRVATTSGVRAAPKGGRVGQELGERKARAGAAVGSPEICEPGMPILGSKIAIDRIALAALHETIAALLREGAGNGDQQRATESA